MQEVQYGAWVEENPECVALVVESDVIRNVQLCWVSFRGCCCSQILPLLNHTGVGLIGVIPCL